MRKLDKSLTLSRKDLASFPIYSNKFTYQVEVALVHGDQLLTLHVHFFCLLFSLNRRWLRRETVYVAHRTIPRKKASTQTLDTWGPYYLHKPPGWKAVHKHKTVKFNKVGERMATKYIKIS